MESTGTWQRIHHFLAKGRSLLHGCYERLGGLVPQSWVQRVGALVEGVWNWLNTSPNLGPLSIILLCGLVLLAQTFGYHEQYLPWLPQSGLEVSGGWRQPPFSSLFYHYVSPYLKLIAMLGGVLFHLALLRSTTQVRRLIVPLWIVSGFLAVWMVMADYYDYKETANTMLVGQPFSAWAFAGKALALTLLILAPAITLSYYQTRLIWEKYVLRSVAQPMAFCILSIACIVVLFDLEDNLKDFQRQKVPVVQIIGFYVNLFPQIFVEAASPALVLATLFGLVKLVRWNEMISLMNAGQSLVRISAPVLVLAGFICLLSMAANYHWAPRAEGQRQAIVKGLKKANTGSIMHSSVMYYNEKNRRSWFIGTVPFNLREERMKRIQVREMDENGLPKRALYASTAIWWPEGMWSFYRGQEVIYEDGVPSKTIQFATNTNGVQRLDTYWKETPWDIMAPTLNPNNMGVPELAAYLETPGMVKEEALRKHYTAELWHRLTFPWQGFTLVVIAIPLICQTSRKGVVNGTGLVLAAFVVNHFLLNNVSINLARTAQLPPRLASWIPHVTIGIPAVLLLWWRAYGTAFPFPRLKELAGLSWRNRWRSIRGRRTREWIGRRHRASWLNETTGSV